MSFGKHSRGKKKVKVNELHWMVGKHSRGKY